MKPIAIAVIVAALLSGCTTTSIQHQFQTVDVPETVLQCEAIKKSDFPPMDATNKQVHAFIERLWKNNQLCASNMKAVSTYVSQHNANVIEMNKKAAKVK